MQTSHAPLTMLIVHCLEDMGEHATHATHAPPMLVVVLENVGTTSIPLKNLGRTEFSPGEAGGFGRSIGPSGGLGDLHGRGDGEALWLLSDPTLRPNVGLVGSLFRLQSGSKGVKLLVTRYS